MPVWLQTGDQLLLSVLFLNGLVPMGMHLYADQNDHILSRYCCPYLDNNIIVKWSTSAVSSFGCTENYLRLNDIIMKG